MRRQGVSFFWKSVEKYEINSLSISSKRGQGTESQLPASLNIENLVTNKKFLDASVTSWSQFGPCNGEYAVASSVISETACHLVGAEKMLSHFRLDKNVALGLA